MPRCRSRRSGALLGNEIGNRTGALHLRRARRALALRHTHQATARESIERPLSEPAEASNRPPTPGDDDLASPLYALQVLAEAIVQLADPDLTLWLM
jgi:hypothetical protein